jgi:murein DD-endopeptidase MepM/ murein hydrolase activator NlpD
MRLRAWPVFFLVACAAAAPPPSPTTTAAPLPSTTALPPTTTAPPPSYAPRGTRENQLVDFVFQGGQLEFEMWREGGRVVQIARSRFAVPVMVAWQMSSFENVAPTNGAATGVAMLPPAAAPGGVGPNVLLSELALKDANARYYRYFSFRARFGDPATRPQPYAYALPYQKGTAYTLFQGFHGAFSHTGSNEYALDFDCPVGTPVLAMRSGVVVVANASAQTAGTAPEMKDYKNVNFVIVRHDDGSLGEYMHLAPGGVAVRPGQEVKRLQPLGTSGNTGFSTRPHVHFQVETAGTDGNSALSFPFQLAVAPNRSADPVEGTKYLAWE